jgi:hypothetical protein
MVKVSIHAGPMGNKVAESEFACIPRIGEDIGIASVIDPTIVRVFTVRSVYHVAAGVDAEQLGPGPLTILHADEIS